MPAQRRDSKSKKPGPRRSDERDRELRSWVEPGSMLGYARDLKKARQWPPERDRKPPEDRDKREGPVATAFLVVPFEPGDLGARPVADARVQHSDGVRILDGGGPIDEPTAGQTYTIEATISNRGVAPAYLGLADFYAGSAADVDAAAAGGRPPPALGHTGFMLNPAFGTTVRCPRPWTPASAEEAQATIVVHAYDPTSDMLIAPFDAHTDRHVGRRDVIANFAGVWGGTEATSWGTGPFMVRLIITQSATNLTVAFYGEVGSPPALPSNPQMTSSGTVLGDQATGFVTEYLGGQPFTTNAWTLTLTGPNALQLHNQREFVAPGDNRGTQILHGNLAR